MPAAPGSPNRSSRARRQSARGGAPAQERELRAQGRKTMNKLLQAAVVVFDRRGYHAARVDDIVKVANTSHGTFYLYFANKEDLFRALVTDVSREMLAVSESLGPIGPGPEGYQELRDWVARFAAVYWRYGPVIRAWIEAAIDDEEFGPLGAQASSGFTRTLLNRVRAAMPTTGVDPTIATLALVAMVERLHYIVLVAKLDVDPDVMVDTLATVAHLGLFGSDTTPMVTEGVPAGAGR